jgi:hypothetical protein
LLRIRKENPGLQEGSLELLDSAAMTDRLLAYTRSLDQEMVLVLINLGETECAFTNPTQCEHELFQFGKYRRAEERNIVLHPLSGVVSTTRQIL